MNISYFLIYCFIITFSPGPTHIVTLSIVNNYGIKKALNFCYGSALAFCSILILSVLLNSVLSTYLPKVIYIIQISGSIYILYLAYQIYKIDIKIKKNKNISSF